MASCPAFVEDSCQNRALRKRFAAAASFSFERGKERLDTFPQLIRHITKICLFHGTRLPHLLKSKNMPDILLIENFKTTAKEYQNSTFSKGNPEICSEFVYFIFNKRMNIKIKCIRNELKSIFKFFPTRVKKFIIEYNQIVNFIYNHDAFLKNKNEINKYISILNLYLTNSEYALLFYDAIRDDKKIKIINELHLFSRYSLLNKSHPPCKPEHILFFSPQAFGEDYEEYIERHGLQGKTLKDFLQ